MLTPFPHGLLFYTSMIYIRLTPISSLDQHEEKQTHWTDHHWSAVASLLALLCAPLSHVPSQQVPGPLSANWSNNRWCNSCIDMTMRDKGTNRRCSVRLQLQWIWYLTPVQSASQSSFFWHCLCNKVVTLSRDNTNLTSRYGIVCLLQQWFSRGLWFIWVQTDDMTDVMNSFVPDKERCR